MGSGEPSWAGSDVADAPSRALYLLHIWAEYEGYRSARAFEVGLRCLVVDALSRVCVKRRGVSK